MANCNLSMSVQFAFPVTVGKIHDEADGHPGEEPLPGDGGNFNQKVCAKKHAQYGDDGVGPHNGEDGQYGGEGYEYEEEHFLEAVVAEIDRCFGDARPEEVDKNGKEHGHNKPAVDVG